MIEKTAWSGAALALAFATVLPAQSAATKPEKFGKIYKSQVDGLINGLSQMRREDGSLGDGSGWDTARVLTAMGHSHRAYALTDGPPVRLPLRFLFTRRTASGAFMDPGRQKQSPALTRMAIEAMRVLEPEEHKQEIELAERVVGDSHGKSAWQAKLAEIRARIAGQGVTPIDCGAEAAQRAGHGLVMGADHRPDVSASVDALFHLAACQAVARELDANPRVVAKAGLTQAQKRGLKWLAGHLKDGVYYMSRGDQEFPEPGLTGLAIAAMQTMPPAQRTDADRTTIDQGLRFLGKLQNDDGSFGRNVVNYTTCAVILALSKSGREEFAPALQRAQRYILGIQNIEDRGYGQSDRDYGSIGYGGDQRGDLSNLQFAIEALRNTGLEENHEAFAKAIVFLQRTQNLQAVNDFNARVRDEKGEWQNVKSGNDGGAAYYPGNSPAGYVELPDGTKVPRSYGSMTYALLKTYTLCGLKADDKRIQAAVDWIQRNWTLDINPGSSPLLPAKAKYQGLYYYYMVMAQALETMGVGQLETPAGKVDWRAELSAHLGELQHADGYWMNDKNDRWWEDQAMVCTVYSLLALDHCNR